MKQVLNKIWSLFMAFVVLFSTMSLTVDMHYCGNTLVDTAIFKKAKGCGMDMESPQTEGCSISKKSCCDDKQITIKGQDELKQSVDTITFEKQLFLASFIYTYIHLFTEVDKNVNIIQEYKPPLVVRQIYKLDETYLI
ncbi:HYC_CC_PP family protein [Pseudofulvibacter geojedonensis]|uniref:Secreted protein n=1 Tax=Pseudofulvibacter geojedonensis TaxID=1123758 RepID=A0ABW3I1S3_9FLAO